ncbi:MAG: hypothetical protein A2W05_08430 [Candidatus Schekmanbacteria bacterium RBG_16_38_10]|uniref:RNA-binding S4 domain-containing protein n=1 Tax=Candidatus Schekmanbacteria bacterium RBG_16_38_10 TaxID=1817879 RepID=A0A1F7S1W9_9BACT|nr:MAG: hypothetical protein A2W05_08430 [Candidatus Schekmanbacteria bacterium RBG_16_38_10]
MKNKTRLDKLIVDLGIVKSRERARALIMEGKVYVRGQRVDKAGSMVLPDEEILLKGEDIPYVSRGGIKLEKSLEEFQIKVEGKVAMDVGASTGGFTDCLLKKGTERVYAIDVGYGQLDWNLRNDSRVINLEEKNIRYLEKEKIPEKIDLAVIDVSFISLTKVIPKVLEFLKRSGVIIALIKPQFEVGKGEVGKGGIVKSREKHREVLLKMVEFAIANNLFVKGIIKSPILGQKGNKEFFFYLSKSEYGLNPEEILDKIDEVIEKN